MVLKKTLKKNLLFDNQKELLELWKREISHSSSIMILVKKFENS